MVPPRHLGVLCAVLAVSPLALLSQKAPGSSNQMIARMRNTIFLRAGTLFYSDPEQIYKESPKVQAAAVAELSTELTDLLSALKNHESGKTEDLRQYLNKPLQSTRNVSLKIENHDQPRANVDETGRITMDARVVEAAFGSSLISSLHTDSPKREDKQLTPLEAALADYRRQVDDVRKAHGGTLLSDIFKGNMMEYLNLYFMYQAAENLDGQFYGTLAFVLAHEMGHIALNHFAQIAGAPGGAPNCDAFRNRELDADSFSVALLSEYFMSRSVIAYETDQRTLDLLTQGDRNGYIDIKKGKPAPTRSRDVFATRAEKEKKPPRIPLDVTFVSSSVLKDYAGFATFLNLGFEEAGFKTQGRTGCTYPSNEERVANSQKALDTAVKLYSERVVKRHLAKKFFLALGDSYLGNFRAFSALR